jgi:hypothetical protein
MDQYGAWPMERIKFEQRQKLAAADKKVSVRPCLRPKEDNG